MAKKVDKVIIDTNLWISFLITKDFKKLDEKIKAKSIRLIFSLELIEEFLVVISRPKLKQYFESSDVEKLIDLFDVYGEIVTSKAVLINAEIRRIILYSRSQKILKLITC